VIQIELRIRMDFRWKMVKKNGIIEWFWRFL